MLTTTRTLTPISCTPAWSQHVIDIAYYMHLYIQDIVLTHMSLYIHLYTTNIPLPLLYTYIYTSTEFLFLF